MADSKVTVDIPPCFSTEIKVARNHARQLLFPAESGVLDLSTSPPALKRTTGKVIPLVAGPASVKPGMLALRIGLAGLKAPFAALQQPGIAQWIGNLSPLSPSKVRKSWANTFTFALEDNEAELPGLRLPQLGAVHAMLGFWTTGSTQPATVVMPTGTGKTETMIALLVTEQPQRLLVVVPSDVLRTQIATKFETLGVLQRLEVIKRKAQRPVVGQLKHAFPTPEDARLFAKKCNVIITTPPALFASEPAVLETLLSSCSHLFVDEAHHVEATTWRRIRDTFEGKPVVQFTATPFREDGRRLAGKIVYAFPLRKAQEQGYFSRINYKAVVEFNDPDLAIAMAAIEHLRQDLAKGYDHLLLARVKRIGRAKELLPLYEALAPDLGPVVLHSSISKRDQQKSLAAISDRRSRIIVCVNMLGEGFDLPSLKIAAIHDLHKSLGVTLQFVGRFARVAGEQIGEASIVAGRPEGAYDENLRKLYSEEPDWNYIIRDLSEAAVGEELETGEFEAEFRALPEAVSLRNLEPKMSTVVYRTDCETWNPEAIYELYPEGSLLTDPIAINEKHHVAWFVLESRSPVRWGEMETVADVAYHLFVIYWDEKKNLVYINSSDNKSVHEPLAKAVCGAGAQLFTGEAVYRVMAHVDRLVPTNVGLLDVRNRSRRFSFHAGADVVEGFPVAEAQTKTKTNIFAYGYEGGTRVSVGGSLKGRIWSYRIAPTLKHWMDWCDHVGSKLSDDTISVDDVMRGFIRPEIVESRPPYVVLALEWPWDVFLNVTEETRIKTPSGDWPLFDTDLAIKDFADSGPVIFEVATSDGRFPYEIRFEPDGIKYRALEAEVEVMFRNALTPLSKYLSKRGTTMICEQDVIVVHPGMLLKPERSLPPLDPERLIVVNWQGVDLKKESQGPTRDSDSIQARTIEHMMSEDQWELIIDDDRPRESADVVAMRVEKDTLVVELTHCKYSSEPQPGGRVEDLYQVCGQAQKSVTWRRDVATFFRHLIRREQNRLRRTGVSGLIVGTGNDLYRLEDQSRLLKPEFHITIAQPGLSKARVSSEQLDLLASVEVYVYEVANAAFRVLCSE